MSLFTNKRVLVIGEENSQIKLLKNELESRGVIMSRLKCDEVLSEKITETKIDLIIFNHMSDCKECLDVQKKLTKDDSIPLIPVFTLVHDTIEDKQRALIEGAADYITSKEEIDSIVQKIEVIFDADNVFPNSSSIDISSKEAHISTTGIRVFVVEDDPLLRNLLSIKLNKTSFPHEFSRDGKNIVPTIQQFKPDVIILDLMLPGISGFDVLKDLKSNDSLKNVPVVVFSNRDGAEDRVRAKELGAVSFYVKAMTDLSELIETIESLVKK